MFGLFFLCFFQLHHIFFSSLLEVLDISSCLSISVNSSSSVYSFAALVIVKPVDASFTAATVARNRISQRGRLRVKGSAALSSHANNLDFLSLPTLVNSSQNSVAAIATRKTSSTARVTASIFLERLFRDSCSLKNTHPQVCSELSETMICASACSKAPLNEVQENT